MLAILKKRRSIRKYQNKTIESEKINALKEALLRSPSSRGLNPWRFIFIDDKNLLEKCAGAKPHGAAFLARAPLGIIICGNAEESDVWIEDCSIAAIIAQLTAQSLGLGSCWIQIRGRSHSEDLSADAWLKKLLDLPNNLHVECIISIGYPAEEKQGIAESDLPYSKIFHNAYEI